MNSRWEIPRKPFMDEECFECGEIGECHQHHVVPKSVGGARTVLLCLKCHALVHDRHQFSAGALTRAGMKAARERGVKFGRGTVVTEDQRTRAKEILQLNPDTSATSLSRQLGLSLGTANRLKRKFMAYLGPQAGWVLL